MMYAIKNVHNTTSSVIRFLMCVTLSHFAIIWPKCIFGRYGEAKRAFIYLLGLTCFVQNPHLLCGMSCRCQSIISMNHGLVSQVLGMCMWIWTCLSVMLLFSYVEPCCLKPRYTIPCSLKPRHSGADNLQGTSLYVHAKHEAHLLCPEEWTLNLTSNKDAVFHSICDPYFCLE